MPPEPTDPARPSRLPPIIVAVLLAGCAAGALTPTATAPTQAPTDLPSAIPSVAPTPSPPPLRALLDDWRLVREGTQGIGLVVDGALLASNYDTYTVTRFDPDT